MPISANDILLGIIAPASVAMILFCLAATWLGSPHSRGIAAAAAAALGIASGCWLLQTSPIVPKLDRDWLPYAAFFALLPSLVSPSLVFPSRVFPSRVFASLGKERQPSLSVPRWLALLACIGLVAWLVVPTWESLTPSRSVHMLVWSGLTLLLCGGCELITIRLSNMQPKFSASTDSADVAGDTPVTEASARRLQMPQTVWLGSMVVTMFFAAGLLAVSGSLRFGQVAAAGMSAYAGLAIAALVLGKSISLRSAAWVYAVFIAAALLTGKVNSFSDIPSLSYMLMPFAPLACGLAMKSEGSVWRRFVLPISLGLLVCGIAMGLAVVAEFDSLMAAGSEY